MTRGRKANDEARATARALAASGTSTADIMKALAESGVTVTRRQVQRWCEGLLGGPGPRPSVDAAPFEAAVAAGASLRQAAKETGVSRRTAARRTARHDA